MVTRKPLGECVVSSFRSGGLSGMSLHFLGARRLGFRNASKEADVRLQKYSRWLRPRTPRPNRKVLNSFASHANSLAVVWSKSELP